MNKVLQLKIASLILFWVGVIAQMFTVSIVLYQYRTLGYSPYLNPFETDILWINLTTSLYFGLIHVTHILAGYWLSKGKRKGVIFGLGVGLYEILGFVVTQDPILFTAYGITIRILFAIVIFLIVLRRKELVNLQSENWRPWKNPRTISTRNETIDHK